MSYIYNTNATASYDGALIRLKEDLVAAGWLLKGSGNGIGGSNFSNLDTSGPTQATDYFTGTLPSDGTLNYRAWFRLRTPTTLSNGTYRELVFQKVSTGYTRVKYSLCVSGTGFSGSVIADSGTTPSAYTTGDEYFVMGTGSDASPTSGDLPYCNIGNNLRYSSICNNEAPYNFYMFSFRGIYKDYRACMAFDPLSSGSYNILDLDPYVFYWKNMNFGSSVDYAKGILAYGKVNQTMASLSVTRVPDIGVGHIASEDNMLPVSYYRAEGLSAPYGWKGRSAVILEPTTHALRFTLDTYSVNSTRDKIFFKADGSSTYLCPIFPWDGSIPIY